MESLLPRAAAVGISKKHSSIYFQAQEMRDLLASEKAEEAYLSSLALAQLQLSSAGTKAPLPTIAGPTDHSQQSALTEQARRPTPLIIDARPALWGGSNERLPESPSGAAMLKRETSRGGEQGIHDLRGTPANTLRREDSQQRFAMLLRALDVYVEDVDTAVHDAAPLRPRFVDVLRGMRDDFSEFLSRAEDMQRTEEILSLVSLSVGLEGIETEQCREQEQEKEQEQEQEQEIEMERYVDMAYQRDGEETKHWALVTLTDPDAPQFSAASSFQLYGRNPLAFSPDLRISVNHYDPKWVGSRRLKNACVSLEWIPEVASLRPKAAAAAELSETSNQRLDKALRLLDIDDDGCFEPCELAEVLRSAEGVDLSEEELDALLVEYGRTSAPVGVVGHPQSGASGAVTGERRRSMLKLDELKGVLTSGKYRKQQSGRHYVLLSLAEAETIRCILHLRQGQTPIHGADTALALRCIGPDIVLDRSTNFVEAEAYQRAVANNSFRFFNCETHYKPGDINILLREISAEPLARRFFFTAMVSCRRRLAKRWEQTPLAKLFTLQDQWSLLKQRAQAVRMREAIRARGLLLHDAFQKFDWDRNGFLSMGEMYAALEWLRLPGLTPQDVIFFMRSAGAETMQLSYTEFIALLLPDELDSDADAAAPASSQLPGDVDLHQVAAATDAATCVCAPSPAAGVAAPPALVRQVSRVMPKYEDELR